MNQDQYPKPSRNYDGSHRNQQNQYYQGGNNNNQPSHQGQGQGGTRENPEVLQEQQNQLQQLTNLLVNAITQQQQQQYAAQVSQLLSAVNHIQQPGPGDNGTPGCESNGQTQNVPGKMQGLPQSQIQAAQMAAAAVTAKHKQVVSINQRGQNSMTPNACTVQCIDPVTGRVEP